MRTTSSPCGWVFVCGRWRIQDCGLQIDLLKPEQSGRGIDEGVEEEIGRSLPKWHWPQKAAQVQAATAASKGRLRLRLVTNCESMRAVIWSWGMRFEVIGAKLCTLLRTWRSLVLPFYSRLWAECHAFSADSQAWGVLPVCLPVLEAANVHSTSSSVGKHRCRGICNKLQKAMNWHMAPEYQFTVDLDQPLWMAWLIWDRTWGGR